MSSFQISKIELVAEFESAVMKLYWLYSEKFPEHEVFWIALADDERRNTEWVRSTIEKIKSGTIEYNRDRFNIEAIRTTLNFVKSMALTFPRRFPCSNCSFAAFFCWAA